MSEDSRMDEGTVLENNGGEIDVIRRSEEADEDDEDYDDDASYRTLSYDDDEWMKVDEDILLRLKRNDPTLNQLEVSLDERDQFVDWEKEGRAISENTHIKYLFVANPEDDDTEKYISNMKAFYKGLAGNRSVRILTLANLYIGKYGEDISTILEPFFEHNNNLRSLDLADAHDLSPKFLLSINNKHIRSIDIDCCGGDDELMAKSISALETYQSLTKLRLNMNNKTTNWIVELGNMLQTTTKLRELILSRNDITDEGAAILGAKLGRNSTVKKLSMQQIDSITTIGMQSFLQKLSNNSTLEELNISDNHLDDRVLAELARSFGASTNLKSLIISSVKEESSLNSLNHALNQYGWRTLLNSVLRPDSGIEKLDIFGCDYINDDGLRLLGNNLTLKTLTFANSRYSTFDGWGAFCQCFSNPGTMLEELTVQCLGDTTTGMLTNSLANNIKLRKLNLECNRNISPEVWRIFFDTLRTSNVPLDELYLSENRGINDSVVPSMANALGGISSLSILNLSYCTSITAVGWMALSTILQRPTSRLKELILQGNVTMEDNILIGFANAIVGNSRLETLYLENYQSRATHIGVNVLIQVLCYASSIESIYTSNHTLKNIGGRIGDFDLSPYLDLNKRESKAAVVRQKIIQYYFMDGYKNKEELVDMELNMIPHVIAWMGMDDSGLSLLCNFARSMPSLFDSESMKAA